MGRLLTMLEEAAEMEEDRLAIAEGSDRITYGQLVQEVRRLAEVIAADHPVTYGLVMDQSVPSVLLLLALLESGHDVLPLDELQTTSDLWRIERICPISRWLVPDSKANQYEAKLKEGRWLRYSDCVVGDQRAAKDSGHASGSQREAVLYQLTSGTTGESKLARLTLATVQREGKVYRDWFGYERADRVVLTAPLNHLYGLSGGLFAALCASCTLIVCRRPTPRKTIRLVRDYGATILLGVPQLYQLLSDSQLLCAADCSRMRFAICAGGPLPIDVPAKYEAKVQHRILQVYGSTETGVVAAHHPQRTYATGCSGELLPHVQAWVQEEERLAVASPSLFAGYVTADGDENPVQHGAYVTDDLATIKQGHVYLRGRRPKFINVAGRKVNPREIEEVCRHIPSIHDVNVFGQPDQLHGEIIVAHFVADAPIAMKELKSYLRLHLADYKVPHRIQQVDQLKQAWKERYASTESGDGGDSQ